MATLAMPAAAPASSSDQRTPAQDTTAASAHDAPAASAHIFQRPRHLPIVLDHPLYQGGRITADTPQETRAPVKVRWSSRSTNIAMLRLYPRTTNLVPPNSRSVPPSRRPTRNPPMRAFGGHEIYPGDDPDQTRVNAKTKAEEMMLRDLRNRLMKEKLKRGESVQYQSTGWSMYPLIYSEDTCVFEPLCGDPQLDQLPVEEGDCVFCEVQPNNRFYAHAVIDIIPASQNEGTQYIIGNANGQRNGYCYRRHIYGRLSEAVWGCM